jgi:glycosyltransferase involved in cell wall biosynthesis
MISKLLSFVPDIVFTDFGANPSWYAKLYGLLCSRQVPLVVLLRGDLWNEYQERFHAIGYPSKLLGPLYKFSWINGLGFADRILAICGWLKEAVLERYPEKRVGLLYEGIDSQDFLGNDGFTFDFKQPAVGILQNNLILPKVKGLVWFSAVVKKMPDVNFYLAGDGPYTRFVEDAFAGLPNAHFVGHLDYPDGVCRFHRSTDVHVLASGLDCCPASLLEASLCGKPVVASRVGGIPELVQEGGTGWTVPNGETELWVTKIRMLLEDQALAKRFGANGRAFVAKNFNRAVQASKLASILEEEIASS